MRLGLIDEVTNAAATPNVSDFSLWSSRSPAVPESVLLLPYVVRGRLPRKLRSNQSIILEFFDNIMVDEHHSRN